METQENFPSRNACSESLDFDNTQSEKSYLLAANKSLKPPQNYGGVDFHNDSSVTRDFSLMGSSSTPNWSPEGLKRKLKYYFMNPREKWNAKGKFPWKLVLQIVKIFFITLLLYIFGTDGYISEPQKKDISTSFRHLFLPDWTAMRDTDAYPPNIGPYAIYTKAELFTTMDHFVKTYANITNIALGSYCFDGPNCTMTGITFCRQESNMMVAFNFSISFDGDPVTTCHTIPRLYPEGDHRWNLFSIYKFLKEHNDTIEFSRLISIDASFSLLTIFLKSLGNKKYPDCYKFHISAHFDNNERDGKVLVDLETTAEKLKCYQKGDMNFYEWGYIARQTLNCFVICICFLSLLLCIRCLCKAHFLCKETDKYFRQAQDKGLSAQEKMEFVDMWYWMMIVNDLCIITGCILKAAIEQRTVESEQHKTCAILLGSGTLMVYTGVLRYLGFFRKYNVLILTLKRAIPNVLKFMLCCILLYIGLCFVGWVVLGPYHIKFRSLSTTSECLFAMMNGDDLFATFAITNTDNNLIWWFSRIYLYLFISMFIYVVINSLVLFIIKDSYETIKEYYEHGGELSRIQSFISEYSDDSCLSFYQQERRQRKSVWQKLSTVLNF